MAEDVFLVSARKYRPQVFDSVVGQGHVTQTLKNAILQGQLAHAYLFCGPRGVGKTTCARIFAKTINCLNLLPNGDPCNQCETCISFNNGTSLNIYELDAASNNSVDDIRALVDQVRFAPHMGKYKVYIIDEVHMLSQAAFNAFLKTLEEPPSYAKFILATTEKHKILPTILSRCQVFTFNRIGIGDIVEYLKFLCKSEQVEYNEQSLYLIAQKADGGLRDACSIFDQQVAFGGGKLNSERVAENLQMLDEHLMFEFSECILHGNSRDALLKLDTIVKRGFDLNIFLVGLASHFRNLILACDPATYELIECSDELRSRYAQRAVRFSYPVLLKILQLLSQADVNYRSARNQRLFTEAVLLQLCGIPMQDEKKNSLTQTEASSSTNSSEFKNPASVRENSNSSSGKWMSSNPVPVIPKTQWENYKQNSMPLAELITKASQSVRNLSAEIQDKAKEISPAENLSFPPKSEPEKALLTENIHIGDAVFEFLEESGKNSNMFLRMALKNAIMEFKNDAIRIVFQSEADKAYFEEIKNDLYEFMLRRFSPSIRGVVAEVNPPVQEKNHPVPDPFKRFEEIIKKNPWIAEIKRNLNLHLEI